MSHFVRSVCSVNLYSFESPTTIYLSGMSGAGKTFWVRRLIQNTDKMRRSASAKSYVCL